MKHAEVQLSGRAMLWGSFFSLILWAILLGMLVEGMRP